MEISEEEYNKLKEDSENYNAGNEKWCWTKFKKEWISRVFLAWLVLTVVSCFIIFLGVEVRFEVLIFLGSVTLIFMLEKPVAKLIGEKTTVKVDLGASATANIATDTASVIKAIKDGAKAS